MADRYAQLVNTPVGRLVARNTGLPRPAPLERHAPGMPVVSGRVLLGAAPGGRLEETLTGLLATIGAQASRVPPDDATLPFKALVFDATGIADCAQLRALHAFFAPVIRRLERCGRVVVLGTPGEDCADPREATAQRALEGFTRSVGKEARRGGTAQLVLVAPGAEDQLESTLRFLLSPRSAYVSGQVVRITPSSERPQLDWERPLAGRVALVTGAARGIGAAIAARLVSDGWSVHGVDVADGDLTTRAGNRAVVEAALARYGRLDAVVANAGFQHVAPVAEFPEERWDALVALLLTSPFLLAKYAWEALRASGDGRFLVVASVHGLVASPYKAGYVAAKHGVLGLVKVLALEGAPDGISAAAICPAYVRTPLVEAQVEAQAQAHGLPEERVLEEVLLAQQAVKRMLEPEEVAAAAAFVLGPDGRALTGAPLVLDLGWSAR